MRQGLEPSRQLQGLMEPDQSRGRMTHTTHGYRMDIATAGRALAEALWKLTANPVMIRLEKAHLTEHMKHHKG